MLPITSLFTAIFAIILIPLSLQVGLKRISTKISFGDEGDIDLKRRRAAQSNYVQYVPITLFLLALCELAGASANVLYGIGGLLFVGRALHAWCLLATPGMGWTRAAGMILTFTSILFASLYLLWAVSTQAS